MTIALGILAPDCLVLAADTEESDGYLKVHQKKIHMAINIMVTPDVSGEVASIGIAGAGDAGFIDALTHQISSTALKNAEAEDDLFCERISKLTAAFYKRHIHPFGTYPPSEQPDVALLMGISGRNTRERLFVTHKTTVRRSGEFEAVGAGAMFAKMLLKRLYPDEWFDKRTAAILAAYIAYHVKESVPSCGKMTDIVVLSEGKRSYVVGIRLAHALRTVFDFQAGGRLDSRAPIGAVWARDREEKLEKKTFTRVRRQCPYVP